MMTDNSLFSVVNQVNTQFPTEQVGLFFGGFYNGSPKNFSHQVNDVVNSVEKFDFLEFSWEISPENAHAKPMFFTIELAGVIYTALTSTFSPSKFIIMEAKIPKIGTPFTQFTASNVPGQPNVTFLISIQIKKFTI